MNTISKIFLQEKAENGKGNAELLNRLDELLDERPGIISGQKSRRKKLKTSLDKERVMEKLEGFEK